MTKGKGDPSPVEIARSLKGIRFPASKRDVVEHARGNQAGEDVLAVLEQLPDRQYGNMAEVEKGVGEVR